jgi:hypothetical protein
MLPSTEPFSISASSNPTTGEKRKILDCANSNGIEALILEETPTQKGKKNHNTV